VANHDRPVVVAPASEEREPLKALEAKPHGTRHLHEVHHARDQAGCDEMSQFREEVGLTKGRIMVRGKLVTRGKAKRADYILYYKPNIPIALIEAKDNTYSMGDGIQQALDYPTHS